jgi:Cdc6-like AAA superfamily ATPase
MAPATDPTAAANTYQADYSASSVRDAPEPAPGKRRFSYLTSFVGRQDELATLRQLLLSPGKPPITIIGTGGSGKTRLALQTIGSVREQFPDGVCFVPLDVIRRHTLVLAEIANKLGIKEMAPSNESIPRRLTAKHSRDVDALFRLMAFMNGARLAAPRFPSRLG